ncbi:hypothetical protein ACH5RR_002013 [Cinchona calisaya]|uniref:KIB1-4 beta-propeller domain-containing protein n=1 Tax=Cinchona calisaya TaxID=153742 RepID=A0ABD3B6C1_9GENT
MAPKRISRRSIAHNKKRAEARLIGLAEDEEQKPLTTISASLANIQPRPSILICHGKQNSPTDPNCRAFFLNGPLNFNISYKIGAKEFQRQELNLGDDYLIDAINFQGKIYGLSLPSCSLHWPDFAQNDEENLPEFREITNGGLVGDLVPRLDLAHSYLIESCGALLFVHKFCLGSEVVDFKIFRADFGGNRWEKIKSIGDDRVIFIDDWRGFSTSIAGFGIKGNCIYFVNHGGMSVYDLEDQSVLMSSHFDAQESDIR